MALLPDPTTAASECASVKNRLTGSRRRGSGRKNRHRSRTVSKTSLRGARRMRARFRGKDVHNMKARSQDLWLCCLIRRGSGIKTGTGPNSQQNEFKRGPSFKT